MTSRWMNVMRAISNEGYGRIRFYKSVRDLLRKDSTFLAYFEGAEVELPAFYRNIIERDLGRWMQWLPKSALDHDQNAYLHKSLNGTVARVKAGKTVAVG